jgi:hypothetical protein
MPTRLGTKSCLRMLEILSKWTSMIGRSLFWGFQDTQWNECHDQCKMSVKVWYGDAYASRPGL